MVGEPRFKIGSIFGKKQSVGPGFPIHDNMANTVRQLNTFDSQVNHFSDTGACFPENRD